MGCKSGRKGRRVCSASVGMQSSASRGDQYQPLSSRSEPTAYSRLVSLPVQSSTTAKPFAAPNVSPTPAASRPTRNSSSPLSSPTSPPNPPSSASQATQAPGPKRVPSPKSLPNPSTAAFGPTPSRTTSTNVKRGSTSPPSSLNRPGTPSRLPLSPPSHRGSRGSCRPSRRR